jgi:CheY-like chemotaxis protein
VVDDEPVVRRFAVRVLEAEGFLVSEAADGAEALRLLREEVPDVDAVVSDIVMPRLNGVELLQALSSTVEELRRCLGAAGV